MRFPYILISGTPGRLAQKNMRPQESQSRKRIVCFVENLMGHNHS